MAHRRTRAEILKYAERLEDQLEQVTASWQQQQQLIQFQGAALKKLLDGFRPVPFTRKARSRWLPRKQLDALRKLVPEPTEEAQEAVADAEKSVA